MTYKNKKEELAIFGGKPVRKKILSEVHNIDSKELFLIKKVIKDGPLSGFLASKGDKFLGGKYVRKFEASFSSKFKVKHVVSFNSATTALHAAVVALGIGPGDEVIVPSMTMSATATAVLMNGAVPIFADVDPETFCIDPRSVKKCVTKNTKAIIAVNLLGQSADYTNLFKMIDRKKIKIIEDNAQAPWAKHNGKHTGTIGDIGVFSLNVHKTMQVGEGGVLVTNDDNYALRAQLSRNHGEVVIDQMSDYDGSPIIGSNYRLSELHAAMALAQLSKLEFLTKERIKLADYLKKRLGMIQGILLSIIGENNTHVYYRFSFKIDEKILGLTRDKLLSAMSAEGFSMSEGYVKPIYLLPVFQNKKAFNNTQFPFVYEKYSGNPNYKKGICPVAERLYEKELTLTDICQYPYTKKDVDLFVRAFKKVLDSKDELNKKLNEKYII